MLDSSLNFQIARYIKKETKPEQINTGLVICAFFFYQTTHRTRGIWSLISKFYTKLITKIFIFLSSSYKHQSKANEQYITDLKNTNINLSIIITITNTTYWRKTRIDENLQKKKKKKQ